MASASTPLSSCLLATWPNGLGNGLQSRVSGFNSRRRLCKGAGHGPGNGPVVTVWSQKTCDHHSYEPPNIAATSDAAAASSPGITWAYTRSVTAMSA